jgi:hypothetical protein
MAMQELRKSVRAAIGEMVGDPTLRVQCQRYKTGVQ